MTDTGHRVWPPRPVTASGHRSDPATITTRPNTASTGTDTGARSGSRSGRLGVAVGSVVTVSRPGHRR
ncbi:hypothetical protein MB27_26480 [Actinoplanes utahensis]|uniref:Uncharacterized protein n=1 Tax=Actinoplanes utahensis TaxID=1869 RepID=A0A0A6UHG7_ACTUT|nr:hypothetical protein MB27_26480 [Actinoplanes utahensis]